MTRSEKGLYDVMLYSLQKLVYSDIPDFGVLMTLHPLYLRFVMMRSEKGLYDVTLYSLQKLVYSDIPDFGELMTLYPLYLWFCYDAE